MSEYTSDPLCLHAVFLSTVLQSTEVSGNQMMSVVGEVVARALAEDFSTGFRPEDSSEQEQDAEWVNLVQRTRPPPLSLSLFLSRMPNKCLHKTIIPCVQGSA